MPRLAEHAGGARILLKREDLNHTGSHKINNVLGQALLTKRMGKTAGDRRDRRRPARRRHRDRRARCSAWSASVYMGEVDTERQALNVARMRLLGAEVIPVKTGSRTLKDAINEALRDWVTNVDTTHYLLGTVAGPHPFPVMVRDFHRIIGIEARAQMLDRVRPAAGRGGGVRRRRLQRDRHLPPRSSTTRRCALVGFEAGGDGIDTGRHARDAHRGRARRAARRAAPTCCRTTTARPSRRTRSRPGWTTRASDPEHS